MIKQLAGLYSPKYPKALVYMLQNTDYRVGPYLAWYWRTNDFSRVMYRRTLQPTRAAQLLQLLLVIGMATEIVLGLAFIFMWWRYGWAGYWAFGLALVVACPIVWAHLVVLPLIAGRVMIVTPRSYRTIHSAQQIFRDHSGEIIAIVGSYGKTSMKELLLTVLGADKKVAATPANKNVAVSHAALARTLSGDEEILLVEYGEGAPGDVARFARLTHPTRAVVTGVAAAHLDRYRSTQAAATDIFSVADFISNKRRIYVNAEAKAGKPFIKPSFSTYDRGGAAGWKASHIVLSIDGLKFELRHGDQVLRLRSQLLGRHNIGPLSLAAALAAEFGMDAAAIERQIALTKPFEHRMQPYALNGAWVIDDTYNGNIEGIRAGTELLRELPARRKLYVTPGLVDQGKESEAIHREMGKLIAGSGADVVVLVKHSVTKFIESGLREADFNGELIIETDPLNFYTNLGHFVATGDLIMLQNDWPDNYV